MLSEVPFCHLVFKMKIEEKVLLAECNHPSISVFHWLFPNATLCWTQTGSINAGRIMLEEKLLKALTDKGDRIKSQFWKAVPE